MTWVEDDPTIPGMFDFAAVYDLAVEEAPAGSILVEVGVFHGRSLVYLARKAAEVKKDLLVVGVDWGEGIGNGPTADEIVKNLHARGLDCPLIIWDSAKSAQLFRDQSVFFVFLDADHRKEQLTLDIQVWWPKIKAGGILAGHDYDHPTCTWNPEVKPVVDSFFPGAGHKPIPGCWMVRLVNG